ncbi:MAG: type II CAAX endopeptidase family protein [Candidatus Thermoplasmatota archaeon]|nr:type II CAAX endopeptidase family protein [Candidatus Thermoplasmatota archaeon]MED5486304.1 type II CAAX endopeptidase family protein [Candidatus Thermoplasmatota archaeon]|tara:strand:- start:583 stop:1263 length:681 start_codon:yes stop_codon:yes gene_type:complete
MEKRQAAIIALLLVGTAPSISTFCSFVLNNGVASQLIFVFTKLWLLCVPFIWYLKMDGGTFSWSKPEHGGYWVSIGLGITMSIVMVSAWMLLGNAIDTKLLADALEPVGLMEPRVYLLATIYWILINSLLEEYVFRWFLVVKSEELVGEGIPAIILSALIFVVHHTVALFVFGFPWWANLICSLALFIGGAIFSWLYVRYRSIWIPYIAHAICDIAVFGVGAIILF